MESLGAKEGVSMTEAESRKAKKRQTDRNAQRQHRKRQKQYIEGLEAQISLLKSTGKSETTQLATRNLKLQDELQKMHDLWDEMHNVLQRQLELRRNSVLNLQPISKDGCPTPSDDGGKDGGGGIPAFVVDSPSGVSDTAQVHQTSQPEAVALHDSMETARLSDLDDLIFNDALHTGDIPDHFIHAADLGLDDDDFHLSNTQEDPIDDVLRDESHLANAESSDHNDRIGAEATHAESRKAHDDDLQHLSTVDPASTTQDQTPHLSHDNTSACSAMNRRMRWSPMMSNTTQEGNCLPGENGRMETLSLYGDVPLPESDKQNQPDPLECFMEQFSTCLEHTLPALRLHGWSTSGVQEASWNMPMLLFPPLARDKLLHDMLQRASQKPESIGPPALIDFLIDNRQNPLSTDLKAYLAPVRQTRSTSEYLATYWVLYLLFRWQILRSEDAYHSLPSWLRPTPLQLMMHHPLVADLIAWPKIREELVFMSMSDTQQVDDVSADVGRYLTVDISTSESDLLCDPQQIISRILDLKNWKLDREFFNRYPQWKEHAI